MSPAWYVEEPSGQAPGMSVVGRQPCLVCDRAGAALLLLLLLPGEGKHTLGLSVVVVVVYWFDIASLYST